MRPGAAEVLGLEELAGGGLSRARVETLPELRVHGQHRDTHLPCTAPDLRSFERTLKERFAEVGVPASGQQP